MNNKLKAAIILVVMYGLGVASALVWRSCHDHHSLNRRSDFAEHRIRKLQKQLNLTPEQEQSVRGIFQKANERADQINEKVSRELAEIHHDSVIAIGKILTPDQMRDFENLHSRFHRHHRPIPREGSNPADTR